MASSKQGDGCGTLLFLAIVWWLGNKYWEYVSVGLVALLMACVVWLAASLVWQITAAIFREPTPCRGAGRGWHAVFLLVGLVAGGYLFYQDRDNFFWKTFEQILCFTPTLGFLPPWFSTWFSDETESVEQTPPTQRITHSRPMSSSTVTRNRAHTQPGSYNTNDLPNKTNRTGSIRDVDFDLDV